MTAANDKLMISEVVMSFICSDSCENGITKKTCSRKAQANHLFQSISGSKAVHWQTVGRTCGTIWWKKSAGWDGLRMCVDSTCPFHIEKLGMESSGPTLTAFCSAGWPCRNSIGLDCIAILHLSSWACLYICGLSQVSECTLIPSLSLAGWQGACWERGTGAPTTIPSHRSYWDLICVQPMDRHYLACLDLLASCPSLCNTGGPPSLLCPTSLRPQHVAGATLTAYLSAALGGLDCPSDTSHTTTRVNLFCCTASAVVTQPQKLFHSQASWREAKLCSVTGPNTI